jgi:hypothetical protein
MLAILRLSNKGTSEFPGSEVRESNHSFPLTYSAPCSLHNMLFALIYHDW